MKQLSRTSLCATVAISAALAFGSTQASAQDVAAPAIDLPPAAPAEPAPAPPSIVLPPSVAEPAEPAAAEKPAPQPSPAARAQRTASRPASRSEPRAAEPAAEQQANAAGASGPVESAGLAASVDTPAPVAFDVPDAGQPDAVADATERDSVRRAVDVPDEIIVASVLGVIGLGLAGFVATRRRRDEELVEEVYEPEPEFLAEPPATSIPDELAIRRAEHPAAVSPTAAQTAVAIPEGPVPTGEARQQLVEAMAAAPPDEENPFTSYRARRKRARIILQAREQQQREQADEPFDWRTYRSSATLDPAPTPMVDA